MSVASIANGENALMTQAGAAMPLPLLPLRKVASLRRQHLYVHRNDKSRHTEQLGAAMLGIIFANLTNSRRYMQSEMSHQTLYGHLIRGNVGAGLGGVGCRGIIPE